VKPLTLSRRSFLAATAAAIPRSSDPLRWTLTEAAASLRASKISSEELTRLCLARISRLDASLNAFITKSPDSALQEARQADRQRKSGRVTSPLHGIPIALKDNIDTAGIRTTAAAGVFRDRVPAEDAEVTRRLKAAGAVFLGKLNLDEMAFEGTVDVPWVMNGAEATGGAAYRRWLVCRFRRRRLRWPLLRLRRQR